MSRLSSASLFKAVFPFLVVLLITASSLNAEDRSVVQTVNLTQLAEAQGQTIPVYLADQFDQKKPATFVENDVNIFSQYSTVPPFAYTSGNWASNFDFSGVAWDATVAGTLVTDQYIIYANHYQRPVGSKIRFNSQDGTVVERTIIAHKTLKDYDSRILDAAVEKLNAPVPANIKVYPLLDPSGISNISDLIGAPYLMTDQKRRVFAEKIYSFDALSGSDQVVRFWQDYDLPSFMFHAAVTGDSGNPQFMIVDGHLVVTATLYGYNSGKMINDFYGFQVVQDALNQAINDMNDIHILTVVNGTGYGTYFSAGTLVHLMADTPPAGQHFVNWVSSNGGTFADATSADTRFTMPTNDTTVTANFATDGATTYALTYTAGANGSITGTTSQTVDQGADGTTVTAVADTGYHFVSWSDGVTTAARTDTNVQADITVTANFAIDVATTYALTVTSGTGDGTYPSGTVVNISADAAPAGQEFDAWTGDVANLANPASASTTVTMPEAAVALTATYKEINVIGWTKIDDRNTYFVTYSGTWGEYGGGYMGTQNYSFTIGSKAKFTFNGTKARYYGFRRHDLGHADIYVDGVFKQTVDCYNPVTSYDSLLFESETLPAGTHTLEVELNGETSNTGIQVIVDAFGYLPSDPSATYSLTVNSGSGDGDYEEGSLVTITADAAPTGQHFVNWTTANGGTFADANSASTTYTMPANAATVVANYTANAVTQYTLTYTAGANGSITGTTSQTVDQGADGTTVTAVADSGYHFVSWSDGVTTAARTDTNVQADITATANFATTTYALTVTSGTGDGTYASGTVVNISADAAPAGQEFDAWTGDVANLADPASASTTVTMPKANVALTATYKEISVTGWTKIDDRDTDFVTYSGTWGEYGGGYMGTQNYSFTTGSKATFTFNGTKARYYGFRRHDLGHADIYVDGVFKQTVDCYDPVTSYDSLLFESETMTNGTHTLEVVLKGTTSNTGIQVIVDAFGYLPSDGSATYSLTVNSGSGDGTYTAGDTVSITAGAPPAGQEFDAWTGDVANLADPASASTTVTMPEANVALTATYKEIYVPVWTKIDDRDTDFVTYSGTWGEYGGGYMGTQNYSFTTGSKAKFTFNGTKARYYGFRRHDLGHADIYVDGVFKQTVDCYDPVTSYDSLLFESETLTAGTHTLEVELKGTTSNTGIQVIVDAFEYLPSDPSATYSLIVDSGSGDGDYTEGSTVDITADTAPVGQTFDAWIGDTANLADPTSPSTTVTIPTVDVIVTATYKDVPPVNGLVITQEGDIIATVTNPLGGGNKDINIIRDGVKPAEGTSDYQLQYDTFDQNAEPFEEYIGYTYNQTFKFSQIVFQEGIHFNDGGFFANGSLRVQVRRDGQWNDVVSVIDKAYPIGTDSSEFGASFETYTFNLNDEAGDGIRIIGDAGGTNHFISVAELEVFQVP